MNTASRPARVLLVDDSALIRKLVQKHVDEDPRLQVVGTVGSVSEVRNGLVQRGPDVLLVDENLRDGLGTELVRELMTFSPVPVVLFSGSADAAMRRRARRAGVLRVLDKPGTVTQPAAAFWVELRAALRDAASASLPPIRAAERAPLVIGIAISTGGPQVVKRVLAELPADLPPIVLVQHMRETHLGLFAEQLDALTPVRVQLARPGAMLARGHCYVAPGGAQTRLARRGGALTLTLGPPDPVSGHVPSGDALLYSIAFSVGGASVGAVLTGMGSDGAAGLLAMRRSGAATIAQDQATSAVYGMPRVAADLGGVQRVVPLQGIAQALISAARHR
ncbi:MAG: response regulator [Myxococcales bacterium]|nr:response regulator [Myxococcales bacterium]